MLLTSVIKDIVFTFRQFNFNIENLPKIYAFNLEDGSLLIEWIFDDLRIGFNIEPIKTESSWYLVTNKNLGEINASILIV